MRTTLPLLLFIGISPATLAPAKAGLPEALAVVDDVADRVMLFDRVTGDYTGDLTVDDPDGGELLVPFDCEPGAPVTVGEETYEHTLLVGDVKRRRVVVFNADGGEFLKTLFADVAAHGLARDCDGKLLVAAGAAGVRRYDFGGAYLGARVPAEPVDGPNKAWDVLVRCGRGDMLVADPVLDRIVRFDLSGQRLGVFAELPVFVFPEQLAQRRDGRVLVVDTLGNQIHEFSAEGALLRSLSATRPRGVAELLSGDLLVASEDGVQVFDEDGGAPVETKMAGFPETAPRFVRDLGCRHIGLVGDMNGDGLVNGGDIDPFVLAITEPDAFATQYPHVDAGCAGDANRDGLFNAGDIDPFIELIVG